MSLNLDIDKSYLSSSIGPSLFPINLDPSTVNSITTLMKKLRGELLPNSNFYEMENALIAKANSLSQNYSVEYINQEIIAAANCFSQLSGNQYKINHLFGKNKEKERAALLQNLELSIHPTGEVGREPFTSNSKTPSTSSGILSQLSKKTENPHWEIGDIDLILMDLNRRLPPPSPFSTASFMKEPPPLFSSNFMEIPPEEQGGCKLSITRKTEEREESVKQTKSSLSSVILKTAEESFINHLSDLATTVSITREHRLEENVAQRVVGEMWTDLLKAAKTIEKIITLPFVIAIPTALAALEEIPRTKGLSGKIGQIAISLKDSKMIHGYLKFRETIAQIFHSECGVPIALTKSVTDDFVFLKGAMGIAAALKGGDKTLKALREEALLRNSKGISATNNLKDTSQITSIIKSLTPVQRGEIYWVDFQNACGTGKAARPSLIVSSNKINQASEYITVSPISSKSNKIHQNWEVEINRGDFQGKVNVISFKTVDKSNVYAPLPSQRFAKGVDPNMMKKVDAILKDALTQKSFQDLKKIPYKQSFDDLSLKGSGPFTPESLKIAPPFFCTDGSKIRHGEIYWIKTGETQIPGVVLSNDGLNATRNQVIIAPIVQEGEKLNRILEVPLIINDCRSKIKLDRIVSIEKISLLNRVGRLNERTLKETRYALNFVLDTW